MSKKIKVCCAIIEKDDKILVMQRSEKMSLPLKWEFPGGKIEEVETAEECIVREINEELGLEIMVTCNLSANEHDYGDITIELFPFVCKITGGNLECREHKNFIWDKPINLEILDWAEADVPIYGEYLRHLKEIC